jgi:hypothetical protein
MTPLMRALDHHHHRHHLLTAAIAAVSAKNVTISAASMTAPLSAVGQQQV